MNTSTCISCRTVRGDYQPPGGIVYDSPYWMVFLRSKPPLAAGQGFIVLKRHCENVAELTPAEQEALGMIITKTAQALAVVLQPQKVHFALYGENVNHIHLHVTPRVATLPAGNIPLMGVSLWHGLLERLRLRQPIPDAQVAAVADKLKAAFQQVP